MAATVSHLASVRPKGTHVRSLQNPPHRPTDLKILGFEAAFEGLVAETDDAQAMIAGLSIVQDAGSIQAMIERRIYATNKVSKHDERVLRQCRDQLSRVVEHLRERAERLRDACIPEEKRIAQIFDGVLSTRGCAP